MKDETPDTNKLIQKIIDRQTELIELSNMLKSKKIKNFENPLKWFEEINDKNSLFDLSRAV